MRITITHCISDFSFRYVMYKVIKIYNYFIRRFSCLSRLLPCLSKSFMCFAVFWVI